MKKWIAMMLALVMILSLGACKKKDEAAEDKVTAKLLTEMLMTRKDEEGKTVTMKGVLEYDDDYNIIGTKSYEDGELQYEATYDKDMDKPLLEVQYDEDGKETDRTEYTYDANGNRLERKSSYTDDEGNAATYKEVCTYDAKGNVLTEKEYHNGNLEYEYTYTYTATDKVSTETYSRDEYESIDTYTYDEHDNVLSCKSTSKYGDGEAYTRETTYENTYENGKLVEAKCYEEGVLEQYTKYDADGNEILNVYYDEDGEYSRYEQSYENGKIVKRVSKWGDNTTTYNYSYNANGKITEYSSVDSDGSKDRMVYNYDDSGLLTGVKMYDDGEVRMEYTLTYKDVTVSKDVAEKIEAIVDKLGVFNY